MTQDIQHGTASTSTMGGQTILSHLQALTQPSLGLPSAYLHPFAPTPGIINGSSASWKGKGKARSVDSIESQLESIRAMRLSVEQAKVQLMKREGDWGKLSRALKEVISHQTTLLPLSDTLSPSSLSSPNNPLLPSSRISLPPAQLLPALAQSQDIQTYHEDSQFGLLKVTLTLAGNCFVVDVDLETDGAAEDDDPGSANPTPRPISEPSGITTSGDFVRLSKIAVSYVAQGGGMETSEYVAVVLKSAVEAYLVEWNAVAEGLVENGLKGKRLEGCIRRIEGLLAELKALDGSVQGEDGEKCEEAGFASLELIAKRVETLLSGKTSIHPTSRPTICPSFRLFPSDPTDTSDRNPSFRIRPIQPGENVPIPTSDPATVDTQADAKWLLEVVPEAGSTGIAVRKNWLGRTDGMGNPWDGGIKVENLLYKPSLPTLSTAPLGVNPFKYRSTFIHRHSEDAGSLDQHWSLASSGPDGYVIGRMGLPESDDQLKEVFNALRKQIQLNRMSQGIFAGQHLADTEDLDSGAEEDDDMEDLLAAPTAIPITVTQTLDSMILESPLPYSESPGLILRVTVSPDLDDPTLITITADLLGEGADSSMKETIRVAAEGAEKQVNLSRMFRDIELSIKMHSQ